MGVMRALWFPFFFSPLSPSAPVGLVLRVLLHPCKGPRRAAGPPTGARSIGICAGSHTEGGQGGRAGRGDHRGRPMPLTDKPPSPDSAGKRRASVSLVGISPPVGGGSAALLALVAPRRLGAGAVPEPRHPVPRGGRRRRRAERPGTPPPLPLPPPFQRVEVVYGPEPFSFQTD